MVLFIHKLSLLSSVYAVEKLSIFKEFPPRAFYIIYNGIFFPLLIRIALLYLYLYTFFFLITGVCTNATAPSVSSINRILRNRAAERAAAEFARAAGYGLYPPNPYGGFPWPSPAHLWTPGSSNFPGISPGSNSASGTGGSPGSGSHDTLCSPDGSRLIGKRILINYYYDKAELEIKKEIIYESNTDDITDLT